MFDSDGNAKKLSRASAKKLAICYFQVRISNLRIIIPTESIQELRDHSFGNVTDLETPLTDDRILITAGILEELQDLS